MNPPINNVSSGEEDQNNYESADDDPHLLVSPNRPHQSPSASPRALLRPDPPAADEVLESVGNRLRNLTAREERAANRNATRRAQEQAAAAAEAAVPVAGAMTDYDATNGVDGADALSKAIQALKPVQWEDEEIKWFFNQVEIKLETAGVKKQWTKL